MWCDMVQIWNIIDGCGEIMGNCGSFVLRLMITIHLSNHIFVTCVTGADWISAGVDGHVSFVTRNSFGTFL